MPNSIESYQRQLLGINPQNEDMITDTTEALNCAYATYDAKLKVFATEQVLQRRKFAYRGRKRHESRPHHLPASPVKAEAHLTGVPGVPWRRA